MPCLSVSDSSHTIDGQIGDLHQEIHRQNLSSDFRMVIVVRRFTSLKILLCLSTLIRLAIELVYSAMVSIVATVFSLKRKLEMGRCLGYEVLVLTDQHEGNQESQTCRVVCSTEGM